MFKFLHAADIHLDSPMLGLQRYPGVPVEEARLATRKALDNLVDLAIEQEVAFVLVAGDVYDGNWKDFNTGLHFGQAMTRLKEAAIPVLIVAGNHDAESQIQRQLSMPSNVTWFPTSKPKTQRIEAVGVAVHAQGFASYKTLDNLAAGYPEGDSSLFNIGLLHTALDGQHGHDPYAPCSLRDLQEKRYDYWALGHVHTPVIICEDPWVVFPGNTQGRSVRETGARGCALVTVEHGKVVSVESRALDVLRWAICNVDAAGCASPDDIVERAAAAIEAERQQARDRMLAVRVVISGTSEAHGELTRDENRWVSEIRQLVNERSGGSAWVEKVQLKTSAAVSLEELRLRDDPLGELVRSIESMEQSDRPLEGLLAEGSDFKSDLDDLRKALGAMGIAEHADIDATEVLVEVKNLLVSRLLAGGAQ